MKNYLLFILLIFFTINCSSQTYTPFPENTGYWNVSKANCGLCFNWQCVCSYENYSLIGDTTIGIYSYKKVYLTSQNDSLNIITPYEYYGGIRNDTANKKVYFCPKNQSDTLLYNFNLNLGDTLPKSYIHLENDTMIIDSIQNITLNGHSYKFYRLYDVQAQISHYYLVEGIGSTFGLFENIVTSFEQDDNLQCFKYHNDSLVYEFYAFQNNLPATTCNFINDLNYKTIKNYSFKLHPNPVIKESILEFKNDHNELKYFSIYDIYGRLIKKFQSTNNRLSIINKDFSQGTYILQVKSQNRLYNSLKFIVN